MRMDQPHCILIHVDYYLTAPLRWGYCVVKPIVSLTFEPHSEILASFWFRSIHVCVIKDRKTDRQKHISLYFQY